MPIYKGADLIGTVYSGSSEISRIYKGADLVFDSAGGGAPGLWAPDADTTFLCLWNTATPVDEVSGAVGTLFGNAYVDTVNRRLVLDGANDFVTFPSGGTTRFDLPVESTLEYFLKMASNQLGGIVARGAAGTHRWAEYASGSGGNVTLYYGPTTYAGHGANGINDNNLNHVATVSSVANGRLKAKNGAIVSSAAGTHSPVSNTSDALYIGNDPESVSTRDILGEIGPVRISKVARYTAAFTAPDPLLV